MQKMLWMVRLDFQRWLANMDYLHLSITELHELLKTGKVTPVDLVNEAIRKAKEDDNNAFEYIMEKEAMEIANNLPPFEDNNPLWGIPFVIKDNYSTKDVLTTGSSNILNGYVPVFSSEVYQRLLNKHAIPVAKTTLDELAMGGTGTTGHLGRTYNPWDKSHKHQVGGSSCGSAAAVSAGIVPFSIGSDTGDSVRKPASFANLVGNKPTWGRISRFGLFPFAPSLDHVAFFTRNVADSAIVLNCLAGRDDKDSSSSFKEVEDYTLELNKDTKGKKIAVIKEIVDSIDNKDILDAFNKSINKMKENGFVVDYVSVDERLLKAIYPAYIVISCAEATSNNANLDGVKFGPRYDGDTYQEVMMKARTNGFSELIRRRFIIGSYSLLRENQEELFLRAQKARRLIVNAINKVLEQYDAIYCPASPDIAPLFEGSSDKLSNEYLIADNYLAIANFAGMPSITFPLGFSSGLPFGANITCKAFKESESLNIANKIEELIGLDNLVAKEEK